MAERWDALWRNAALATMADGDGGWGVIASGAIAVRDGRIAWIGPEADLPGDAERRAATVRDAAGRWITPALVDCHTHLVFGGDRADEFERRLRGESYQEIARSGGGILSTVRATRAADEESLYRSAARRARRLLAEGVTTIEVKSGYGLGVDSELRMLRVGRRLGRELPLTVRTTLLSAHALPPEFEGDRAGFLRRVREEILPRAAAEGLADAVDAFCDEIAFSRRECEGVLRDGAELGLDLRLHADQLSDQGGAALAARLGARSADHLEYTSDEGVAAMAGSGTVAVLLPGAYHFLGGDRVPPVEAFRTRGVAMAVATDLNPGSSPLASLLLAMNLACVHFGLTPLEALAGVTRHGARVLGLEAERGTLEEAKAADFVLWDVGHPRELAYWAGANPSAAVVRAGRPLPTEGMPGEAEPPSEGAENDEGP
nr:imidazolonepropionase [Gemmatimonadota bacterium]NIR80992.1 imidazolonepropionase [Gemmatimonadota bacterium]NIT89817.1 imidazolonepropionase [Gemmatimonadota bacterium]NIU33605.1 imidazolonepropionase [Gemmatimonadota bacterium]NIU37858.1 imidazolonepropionase [Gemmatimonadota bacterium]